MSTKWLDNLLLVETIFGIHRNYCNQKKIKKHLIIFKIIFQTILNTTVISTKVYFMLSSGPDQIVIIYCAFGISAYLNAVSSVATGVWYSGAFMSYYRSITHVSKRFKDDKKLISSQKKIYWSTIIIILSFMAFVIIRSLEVLKKFTKMHVLQVFLTFVVQTYIRLTIVYQHLMLFVVIMIVVYLCSCLTSLVKVVQESCDISSDEHCDVTREQIQGWVELYENLVNCCKKVTLCFGSQFFFSIVLSTPHYVLMIYQVFYQFDLSTVYSDELKTVTIAIFTYGLVMLMPIAAGQLARNQGMKFHRMIARLYNTMLIIDSREVEAKLIKDFIRLVKKNPLEIKLVSKVPAGMYMLPVLLMLAINHAIVMLQFNHVI